jgi:hypothetical protein
MWVPEVDVPSLYAILIGAVWTLLIGYVVPHVMLRVRGVRPDRQDWRTGPLGLVERFVYFAAALAGVPEVIAAWLVLKAASGWKRWTDHPGTFNKFAIGTALNLACGVSGSVMAVGAAQWDWWLVIAAMAAPLALMLLVVLHVQAPDWLLRYIEAKPSSSAPSVRRTARPRARARPE